MESQNSKIQVKTVIIAAVDELGGVSPEREYVSDDNGKLLFIRAPVTPETPK